MIDSYSLSMPPTALTTAFPGPASSDPASGRGDSNPGPPPPKGSSSPVRSVPNRPVASREGDAVGGLTRLALYAARDASDTGTRQIRRHSADVERELGDRCEHRVVTVGVEWTTCRRCDSMWKTPTTPRGLEISAIFIDEAVETPLGWWDAMHDEGAHVAWGLWAEGRP